MDEEKQKLLLNFNNLEEELLDSPYKEDFSILREAWNVEVSKPGCTNCIKNAAKGKYHSLALNMLQHGLSIEDSKKIHDKRQELSKKHQEVAKEINDEIEKDIQSIKNKQNEGEPEDPFKS